MAPNMDWSHDFCLYCDRQIAEGAYCSQACRVADLEKAQTAASNLSSSASSSSSSSSSSAGFHLPPAVNFAAFKAPSASRGFDLSPTTTSHYYSTNNSYFTQTTASSSAAAASSPPHQRSLSPSSSRSSLSSASSQSAQGISVQAARQLNSYVRSFDQVRDIKRRLTTY